MISPQDMYANQIRVLVDHLVEADDLISPQEKPHPHAVVVAVRTVGKAGRTEFDPLVHAAAAIAWEDLSDCAQNRPLASKKLDVEWRVQAQIVRDIFGNPFRWITSLNAPPRTHRIQTLAQAIYEDRHMPAGTFDLDALLVLSDALEEAGCADEAILSHLREPGAIHVRGCWVIDLLLQKA